MNYLAIDKNTLAGPVEREKTIDWDSEEAHINGENEYADYLASLPRYQSTFELEVGRMYVEGKDFEFGKRQRFFTDEQQWQQMSIAEKEECFEKMAVPLQDVKEPIQYKCVHAECGRVICDCGVSETVYQPKDVKEDAANFSYCQSEIEFGKKCLTQCSHCKVYYKPLEEDAAKCTCEEFSKQRALCPVCDKEKYDKMTQRFKEAIQPKASTDVVRCETCKGNGYNYATGGIPGQVEGFKYICANCGGIGTQPKESGEDAAKRKPFFEAEVRGWLNQYLKEEISFSRFVELLNEKA